MNSLGGAKEVVGVYLIDSWLKDVRLAVTGHDFKDTMDDKALSTAALRVTSVALRAIGVMLARGCVMALFGGSLVTAVALFVLSHDFIVLGNNTSSLVDKFSAGLFLKQARKLSQIVRNNITDFPKLVKAYEELDEVKDKALLKEIKSGTIIDGWQESAFFLLDSSKQKS